MDDIYWSGYIAAFILQVMSLMISLSYIFSTRAKNLKHVGLYYSISQWKFIESKKPWFFWLLFSILFSLFIEPFLSWINVIFRVYWYIKLINNKISTPEKIKEIQFKLWSRLLNKDEVIGLFKELAEFQGLKGDLWVLWEEFEEDNTLVLQDEDGWYAEIEIFDKINKKFAYYSHTPDYDSEWNNIHEYKIEWSKVFSRILEEKTTHPWEEYYDVKDWVILESEIIERLKGNKFTFMTSDELITKLKNEIAWNKVENLEMKYYLMSKHPEIISNQEFKTMLRAELERIKLILLKFKKLCKKFNIEYEYNERDYLEIKLSENNDNEKETERFVKELELLEENGKCERGEIFDSSNRMKTINTYLNQSKS